MTSFFKFLFSTLSLSIFSGCVTTKIDQSREDPAINIRSFKKDTMEGGYRLQKGDLISIDYVVENTSLERYIINPGDIIEIKAQKFPEISSIQTITPDSSIHVPHLGNISVKNMSIPALTNLLTKEYSSLYRNPNLTITLKEENPNLFWIKESLINRSQQSLQIMSKNIRLPYIGEVEVLNRKISDVEKELDELYALNYPSIQADLRIVKSEKSSLYILGEIKNSGEYKFYNFPSVLQLVSKAGGFTIDSNLQEILLIREVKEHIYFTNLNIEKYLSGDTTLPKLQREDILYIPRRKLKDWSHTAKLIQDLILFRGYSLGISYSKNLDGTLEF